MKLKNSICKHFKKTNKNYKSLSRKKGSALAETILIIAISLVLILVVFYPAISGIFTTAINSINVWFLNSMSMIGMN